MRLKRLVTLSSFLLLTTFIVCVSVYAYNAYCTPPVVTNGHLIMTSSMSNQNLNNGAYLLHARITGSGVTVAKAYTTQQYSLALTTGGSASNGGYAHAYVEGLDSSGTFHSRFDSETYP